MASSAITLSGYCQASRLSPSPYAQRLNAVQPLPTSPTSTAMVATTMALVFIAFPPFRSLDESDYSVFLYGYPPSHPWSVGGEPRNTDFRLCRKVAHATRPVTAGSPPAGRDALRGRASRPRSQASIVELYVLQTTGIFVTTDTGVTVASHVPEAVTVLADSWRQRRLFQRHDMDSHDQSRAARRHCAAFPWRKIARAAAVYLAACWMLLGGAVAQPSGPNGNLPMPPEPLRKRLQ